MNANTWTDAELKRLENKIKSQYAKTYNELRDESKKYFDELQTRSQKQIERLNAGEITQAQFLQWMSTQNLRGQRWEDLRNKMSDRLVKSANVANAYTNDTTPGIYSINHNYEAWKISNAYGDNGDRTLQSKQGDIGAGVSFTAYDERTVERLMTEDPKLMPFARPNVHTYDAQMYYQQHLQSALVSAILQGKDIDQMARSFQVATKKISGTGQAAAIRYARTAVTGAQNAGRQKSYEEAEEMGIEIQKEWIATLDERTRASHQALDGQIVPYSAPFITIYGTQIMHPGDADADPAEVWNCRCTMRAVLPKYTNTKRTTYEEWVEEHSKKYTESEKEKEEEQPQIYDLTFKDNPDKIVSKNQILQDKKTFLIAFDKLPDKVKKTFQNITVEFGHAASQCDIDNKKIYVGQNAEVPDIIHEIGHLIEEYMVDKNELKKYKLALVEGLGIDNIQSKIYHDNNGKPVTCFFVRGDKFESEYQSRLYINNIKEGITKDGTINVGLMAECVAEVFRKYMNGEEITEESKRLIMGVIK